MKAKQPPPPKGRTKRTKRASSADSFTGPDAAREWARGRLQDQDNSMQYYLNQLQRSIDAINDEIRARGLSKERMRQRQALMASMRVMMGQRQALLLALSKSLGLLDSLKDSSEGGDVVFHFASLKRSMSAACCTGCKIYADWQRQENAAFSARHLAGEPQPSDVDTDRDSDTQGAA